MRCLPGLMLGILTLPVFELHAQQVTVQQPVFQNFGTSTTVTVPDRGQTLLGGVNRAAASRNSYGFFPRSTSIGQDYSGSNLSVKVYIHDFQAMDEFLLNQGTPTSQQYGYSHPAARQLVGQSPRTIVSPSSVPGVNPQNEAAKFLALGEIAEREGRIGTAKLHYRMAVKYGSPEAVAKLEAIQQNQIAGN